MSSTTAQKTLAVGDVVKFTAPTNAAEAAARFTVADLRGPRVLIRLHCDLPIPPTECVQASEVEPVR